MRKYETIFIINPDLSEEESRGVIEKVKGVIEGLQGEVLKIEEWGKRKLAYEVKKMPKGLFVLLHFTGTAQLLPEVERNLRLMDAVLKYQTVRLDEKGEKIAQMLSEEKPSEAEEKPESQIESSPGESPQTEEVPEKVTHEEPAEAAESPDDSDKKTQEGAHS
jgi:small subunit ribosomal protein S6